MDRKNFNKLKTLFEKEISEIPTEVITPFDPIMKASRYLEMSHPRIIEVLPDLCEKKYILVNEGDTKFRWNDQANLLGYMLYKTGIPHKPGKGFIDPRIEECFIIVDYKTGKDYPVDRASLFSAARKGIPLEGWSELNEILKL